eukprot:3321781-Rhodomonas_salina.2
MQKHVNSYTRQKEVIRSEIGTSALYLLLLFLFGLTASVQKEPSNVAEWHSNFTVTTSMDAQQNLSFDAGFQEYCKTGPCFLAFGDIDEGAGCSPALSSFMQRVGLCAFSSSPSFDANNSKFKEQTGSNYVSCKCAKPSVVPAACETLTFSKRKESEELWSSQISPVSASARAMRCQGLTERMIRRRLEPFFWRNAGLQLHHPPCRARGERNSSTLSLRIAQS